MDFRAALSLPLVYSFFQNTIGQRRDLYVSDYVKPKAGQRVLDIGCGPADILPHFPFVDYVGVDLSAEYIDAARNRYSNQKTVRATFHCMNAADYVVTEPNSFDIVMANGLLHHLDDEGALGVFLIAKAALKETGYMVSFDGCYDSKQSPLVRKILDLDRGRFVRTEHEYLALANKVFPSVKSDVRSDFFRRLPYTIIFMTCSQSSLSQTEAEYSLTTQK